LGWEEYNKLRRKRISDYFSGYSLNDYINFINSCLQIKDSSIDRQNDYQFKESLSEIFNTLYKHDPKLYIKVIEYYIKMGDPLSLDPIPLTNNLLNIIDSKYVLDLLRFQNRDLMFL
jgi:hypothetical protein